MKKVVSIIFIIAMSFVVSIPIFALSIDDFMTVIPDDTSCFSVHGVYDIKMKRYVTFSTTVIDYNDNNKEKVVNYTLPLIDCSSVKREYTLLEMSDFLLSFGLKVDDIYFTPLDGSYINSVSSFPDAFSKWKFDTGYTSLLLKFTDKQNPFAWTIVNYLNGFTPQNSCGYIGGITDSRLSYSGGFFPFPQFAYLQSDNTLRVTQDLCFFKTSSNTFSTTYHDPLIIPANSYTIHEGDFTIGGSVTPPPTVSTHSVAWSGWSNSVTAKGEYINVAWPSTIMFKLFTGDDENHNYTLAIQEYDANDKAGSVIYCRGLPVTEPLQKNTTYTIRSTLNSYCSLYRGKKYVAHLMDNTTGDFVGSIGFIPQSDVLKVPVSADGDRWNSETGNTLSGAPTGDKDSIIQPGKDLPNAGINNPDNPDSKFNLLNRIKDILSDTVDTVTGVATAFVDASSKIFNVISSSLTSVVKFGAQFPSFIGAFFSWLPQEIVTLLVMIFAVSVASIIIRFFIH